MPHVLRQLSSVICRCPSRFWTPYGSAPHITCPASHRDDVAAVSARWRLRSRRHRTASHGCRAVDRARLRAPVPGLSGTSIASTRGSNPRALSFGVISMAAKNHSADGNVSATPENIDRVLRLPEVLRSLGIGRTTLYLLVRDGRFPAPLHVSTRVRGWRQSAINQYLASVETK